MRNVYRIENPNNGNGPFNDPENRNLYQTMLFYGFPNPGGQMDEQDADFHRRNGHASYGCDSLAGINQWFPRAEREEFADLGLSLVCYQLPDNEPIQPEPNHQIIFNRHDPRNHRINLNIVTMKELSK
jgi:hypothetical protein